VQDCIKWPGSQEVFRGLQNEAPQLSRVAEETEKLIVSKLSRCRGVRSWIVPVVAICAAAGMRVQAAPACAIVSSAGCRASWLLRGMTASFGVFVLEDARCSRHRAGETG